MEGKETFYITTPIFYPNAKLHLGHAYTTTLADILARHRRLIGKKVYFLTGSDENTQKLVAAADRENIPVEEFLSGIIANFKQLYGELGISYDQFIRTTDKEMHWPGAQKLWLALVSAGDIYKKEYEGLYCVGHEAFITEKELVGGKCPDHGTVPEHIKEENYFFRLSRYTQAVKEKILSDEFKITPTSRKNEILSLLESGLDDVSFSRPKKHETIGIPVPGDDSQVIYVWCDALANYITALGYGRDDVLYREFWPADVHVIGKDILRFHAAIWPAILLSAGLPLPKGLFVHGFITSGGKKMSKTLGNVIDPQDLIREYGAEALRYYLSRHITPFEDGDITDEHFKDIYNANLANGLGNLASRIMKLAQDNLDGGGEPPEREFPIYYTTSFENLQISSAVDEIFRHIGALDQRITLEEPFKLVKTDPERGKALLLELTHELYFVARMLEPIMPETSKKIMQAVIENKKPENLFARKD